MTDIRTQAAAGRSMDSALGTVIDTGQLSGTITGLTATQVAERVQRGMVNGAPAPVGRSIGQIVRTNLVTRFNVLLGGLFVAALAVGAVKDTLFIGVVVANLVVGIVQELRAKRTLQRLTVIDAAPARVRRDGVVIAIDSAGIVLDDALEVARGDQVPVDGVVVRQTGLEVDESLLTGEADPVAKAVGDHMLSGSVVVAGSATIGVTKVGDAAYARRLTNTAREFSMTGSELRAGTDRILRAVTWAIVPTAVLLLWSQLLANESVASAVQGTVAGVSAMVPEGLVLLTSIAFAAGVVRLGQRNVLTRELGALEGLARVDIVLVDKTGTLTEPGMWVVAVEGLAGGDSMLAARSALAALAASDRDPNPTMVAIARAFPEPSPWTILERAPFSSERRWSAARFAGEGTWFLGAAEALVSLHDQERVAFATGEHHRAGDRVLVLAHSASVSVLSPGLKPSGVVDLVAIVSLAEKVKGHVADTIAYFEQQGISVKVLSGDNPATVAAIAARVGIGSSPAVDASQFPEDPASLARFVADHQVFGRVRPEQKQAVVAALQHAGHTVAMTGDGVNDLLALKRADVGVAMGQGSAASRSVAQFVLLDGTFAALPAVVAEGRRVIANVERVARLFVTKTVYALTLALATGVARLPFPLLPRQLSLVAGLSIGVPGFVLAMEPNDTRAAPGFVRRVATMAVPAGVISAAATFAAYADAGSDGASLSQARTTATIVLFVVATSVLGSVARPLNRRRVAMLGLLVGLFVVALALPVSRNYFEFAAPPARTWATGGVLITTAIAALAAARSWVARRAAT